MEESKDIVFPARYVSLSAAAVAWSGSTDINSASTPCHDAAIRGRHRPPFCAPPTAAQICLSHYLPYFNRP
jgi:hypothetical protein